MHAPLDGLVPGRVRYLSWPYVPDILISEIFSPKVTHGEYWVQQIVVAPGERPSIRRSDGPESWKQKVGSGAIKLPLDTKHTFNLI